MASANLRFLALRKRLAALLDTDAPAEDLLDRLLGELYRALPHYAVVGYLRADAGGLTVLAIRGADVAASAALASGAAWMAAEARAPIFIPDLTQDERARPLREAIVAELAIPALRDDELLGVLAVQSDRRGALGLGDRELLTWLAAQLSKRRELHGR